MRNVTKLIAPVLLAGFMTASMPAQAATHAKPAKNDKVKTVKVEKKQTVKPAKTS